MRGGRPRRSTGRAIGGRPARRALGITALAVAPFALASPALAREGSQFRPAVQSRGGIVASESLEASRVARRVLDEGGNAVDAAAAATFAIGVARPQSCGIGGGGFLVLRTAGGRVASLDFREEAPAAVTPYTFARPGPHRSFTGHRTVGVPGTVAAMDTLLDRYGTLSLAEAIAPAERLAREGFTVPESFSRATQNNLARIRLFPATARQFLRNGEPYPAGSRLVQRDLADTYALIAREGPDAFYRGRIARQILASMRRAEQQLPGDVGLMVKRDLASYRPVFRRALVGRYRGRQVVVAPPPTSGGIATLEMLNLLEGFDLRRFGPSSADALHAIAESQKIAFADRGAYVADPDVVRVPTRTLTSKAYAARRRSEIRLARAGTYRPGLGALPTARPAGRDLNPQASTTHLSVVDAVGNAVALTCTIEQEYGSAVVAPGTGILLNNELTDFSDPGTANEPRGGKRPRSSISPTIVVERGVPRVVVGGAGGVRIIMGSLLTVVGVVDFQRDVAQAVDAERIDAPGPRMTIEEARVLPDVVAELARRGHTLVRVGEYDIRPRVNVAGVDPRTNLRLGVSDPRTDPATLASERPVAERRARRDVLTPSVRLRVSERERGRRTVVTVTVTGRDRGRAGIAGYVVRTSQDGDRVTTARVEPGGRLPSYGPFRRGDDVSVDVRAVDAAGNLSAYRRASVGFRRSGRLELRVAR